MPVVPFGRRSQRLMLPPNHQQSPAHPVPTMRGVSRSSRTLGAGCDGRLSCARRTHVLSGRRSRSVLIPRRWYQVGDDASHRADDGGNKARSPGRLRRKPLKPLRRECLGAKPSMKSMARAPCVHRCVAIRCGQDFSTTYPWKPAQMRCSRPSVWWRPDRNRRTKSLLWNTTLGNLSAQGPTPPNQDTRLERRCAFFGNPVAQPGLRNERTSGARSRSERSMDSGVC